MAGLWTDWSAAPDPLFLWLFPVTFGWVGVALFFVLTLLHPLVFLRRPPSRPGVSIAPFLANLPALSGRAGASRCS